MKLKNVAYLLIIASLLSIVLDLNGFIYTMVQSNSPQFLQMMFNFLLQCASPAGFAWIGFSLLREKKLPEKKIGIAFAILSGLLVGLRIYYMISYFSPLIFWENALSSIFNYLTILFPVCISLFWLLFQAGKTQKGAVWLLTGTIFSCIYSFTGKIFLAVIYISPRNPFGDAWGNYTNLSRMLDILYPLALLVFAFFILKEYGHKKNVKPAHDHSEDEELLDGIVESPETPAETIMQEEKIPSVLDWLSDFLLVMVPLFGLGFLVWRGQNNTDRYRRDWAIAALFWTALGFCLISYLYAPLWQRFEKGGMIVFILLLVILTLFTAAAGLSGKARRNDEDTEREREYVPSISNWFGRIFAISIPLIGFILLIVWAVDDEDKVRKKWAIATLLRMAITLVYYFSLYVTYSNLVRYASSFVHFNF